MQTAIELIKTGKNFSRTFGVGDVSGLAASMKSHGQINPVIVDSSNNLVAGFRRLTAAKELGWEFIETIEYQGENAAVVNLIENMNRTDLTLWEEIQGIKDVLGEQTDADVARTLSKSNTWVRPRTAIWGMPKEFVDKVRIGQSGLKEIKGMMRDKRGPPSATSKLMGVPSQPDIRHAITRLMEAGKQNEARALSFACGAITLDELL